MINEKELLAALVPPGIDLDTVAAVLEELEIEAAYSREAVEKINSEARKLTEKAAELKRAEAPRAERRAVKLQVDRLVQARALLYRLRPPQPGDVTISVPGPGGKN